MIRVDLRAAKALLARIERSGQPNIHLDIDLWVRFGSAERRDREWSDRLPTDPDARCNGLEMGEAIAAGWPAADVRTTWKVPALTASQDAATALIRAVLPNAAWGVSVEPPLQTEPPFNVKYHAFVGDHFPHLNALPGKWWGESSYADGAALALCIALMRAVIAKAEANPEGRA